MSNSEAVTLIKKSQVPFIPAKDQAGKIRFACYYSAARFGKLITLEEACNRIGNKHDVLFGVWNKYLEVVHTHNNQSITVFGTQYIGLQADAIIMASGESSPREVMDNIREIHNQEPKTGFLSDECSPLLDEIMGGEPLAKFPSATVMESEAPKPEKTGGSVNYYKVFVADPTSGSNDSYTAECNDIIEALNMNFTEGNIFKALWRMAAARELGKKKEGFEKPKYDTEKVVFFANRLMSRLLNQQK